VRDQLDALFAHRVYFATASVRDARAAASLMMAEFADTVRAGDANLSALGRPDVRLHLPKHLASWTTPQGRQQPFLAQTIPLHVDAARVARHAQRQSERGGRHLDDLRQPHWDRETPPSRATGSPTVPVPASAAKARPAGPAATTASAQAPQPAVGADLSATARSADATASASVVPAVVPSPRIVSYGELADMDGAQRVRWARTV
jgi:hypothetical protein